jgi:ketosteroid isomerase-like protein
MKIPNVIEELVAAQNSFDSEKYAHTFSETAIVFDEGKTHRGRKEIEQWIERANQQYRARMKPIEYSAELNTLKAEISGTFPGSPLVLTYHLEIRDDKIQSLRIV